MGGGLHSVVNRLRRAAGPADGAGPPDADLLGRFARDGDQGAFELLVWRHAGMVLGVCRRALRDEQGAEDAFQASFLALARKASSVARGESVGGCLHRVARRAAIRAASQASARRGRERPLSDIQLPSAAPGPVAE